MIEPLEELPANRLVLKRYRIVRALARGGMGIVYLGRLEGAAGFAKPVVIKRVLPEIADDESTAQFIREARILSNLQHPGIVGVLDFGYESDSYAMVLEYVHGFHVGHWLKYVRETRGHLPWESCILIVLQVLRALDYAHNNKRPDGTSAAVIHRDVSPSNILLDVDGNVRLVDFGVARMTGEGSSEYETQAGIVKGKLPYLAPELFSAGDPSVQTDVYSTGVVLYQLLTGANPFSATNSGKIIRRVMTHEPPPINALRDDVPADIDRILSKAIAKEASERYATAAAFAKDLARLFRRPESEVFAKMQRYIEADFSGPLAARLGLEPLEELDKAWRDMQEGVDTGRVSLLSTAPPRPSRPAPSRGFLGGSQVRPLVFAVLAGASLIAATAGGVLFLTRDAPESETRRFLVVESPERRVTRGVSASTGPTSAPDLLPSAAAIGSTTVPAAVPKAGARPALGPDAKAAQVSRRFAQRQGAIESCFQRHAQKLQGTPRIAVSFQIAASGKVTAAHLTPVSVAQTPLGGCIVSVAKGTDFGPQQEPLAFSIPIVARVSK
jgi:serine/threonine protein kinase